MQDSTYKLVEISLCVCGYVATNEVCFTVSLASARCNLLPQCSTTTLALSWHATLYKLLLAKASFSLAPLGAPSSMPT